MRENDVLTLTYGASNDGTGITGFTLIDSKNTEIEREVKKSCKDVICTFTASEDGDYTLKMNGVPWGSAGSYALRASFSAIV